MSLLVPNGFGRVHQCGFSPLEVRGDHGNEPGEERCQEEISKHSKTCWLKRGRTSSPDVTKLEVFYDLFDVIVATAKQ